MRMALSVWQRHAFAIGGSGVYVPSRNYFKIVQFGVVWRIFA